LCENLCSPRQPLASFRRSRFSHRLPFCVSLNAAGFNTDLDFPGRARPPRISSPLSLPTRPNIASTPQDAS
ncbi:hypothetical protein CLOM_g21886, partial [Closterium sp. NIES-68]